MPELEKRGELTCSSVHTRGLCQQRAAVQGRQLSVAEQLTLRNYERQWLSGGEVC